MIYTHKHTTQVTEESNSLRLHLIVHICLFNGSVPTENFTQMRVFLNVKVKEPWPIFIIQRY